MEYDITKENGTYEIELDLVLNEFDYPVCLMRITGCSNRFDELKLRRVVEVDIKKEKILEAIKGIISDFEEKFKNCKETMESVDQWFKLGCI